MHSAFPVRDSWSRSNSILIFSRRYIRNFLLKLSFVWHKLILFDLLKEEKRKKLFQTKPRNFSKPSQLLSFFLWPSLSRDDGSQSTFLLTGCLMTSCVCVFRMFGQWLLVEVTQPPGWIISSRVIYSIPQKCHSLYLADGRGSVYHSHDGDMS